MGEVDDFWHKRHDLFNLIYLPILLGSNIYALAYWTQPNLSIYLYVFITYMLLDSAWVLIIPRCVASPSTILFHHVATFFGLIATYLLDFDFAILGCVGGLVEVNTICLLARRNFRDWHIFGYLFYISWVATRLIMGPWLFYKALTLLWAKYSSLGFVEATVAVGLVSIITLLNILNIKWTWDLFSKQMKSKGEISKGL